MPPPPAHAKTRTVDEAPGLTLVVVIPCLDEEATVAQVIAAIPPRIEGIARIRVVVIDDGSTDQTAARARAAGADVVRHPTNYGLGRAFRSGVQRALELGADLMVNIDGDGQFDPADIPELIAPLLAGEAEFVSASRFKDRQLVPKMPLVKRWGNWAMSRLVSRLSGTRQPFADVSCGFRAYSRETLLNLNLIGKFTYTQETFLDLAYKGFRIAEVPLRVRGVRAVGQSRVAGSLWHYGLQTLLILVRTYRDYRPMRFFGRIAGACAVLALGLFTFLLVHYIRAGQFFPHIWAGLTGGFLAGCALIVGSIGLSADMMHRQRILMERVLYMMQKQSLGRATPRDDDPARLQQPPPG